MPNNEAGFEIIADDTTGAVRMASDCVEGQPSTGTHGLANLVFRDSAGNLTRPQLDASAQLPVNSPTANTALANILSAVDQIEGYTDGVEGLLGTTNSSLSSILTAVDQVEGYIDGVETLITSTNTKLDTANTTLSTISGNVDQLEGFTDGIETLITSSNTKLDTIITQTDTVEALIGTTNSTLSTISGNVDQLEGYVDAVESLINSIDVKLNSLGQKAMTGSVPVVIASDQSAIPVSVSAVTTAATGVAPTTVSVTTSATLISEANSTNRLRQITNNNTTKDVRIGFTNAVTMTNGTRIGPLDTYFCSDYSGDIYGITSTGTAVVAVSVART